MTQPSGQSHRSEVFFLVALPKKSRARVYLVVIYHGHLLSKKDTYALGRKLGFSHQFDPFTVQPKSNWLAYANVFEIPLRGQNFNLACYLVPLWLCLKEKAARTLLGDKLSDLSPGDKCSFLGGPLIQAGVLSFGQKAWRTQWSHHITPKLVTWIGFDLDLIPSSSFFITYPRTQHAISSRCP